jgi:uncharacterized protein (DUF1697 family)
VTDARQTLVFLLRGINVGGHKKLPMAELREVARTLGFQDPSTYVQSGNLVCNVAQPPALAAAALSQALENHFGFPVDVVVRTAGAWLELAAGSPFPDAEQERPRFLHLGPASRPLAPNAQEALAPYVRGGERVRADGDTIWIDYADGAGRARGAACGNDQDCADGTCHCRAEGGGDGGARESAASPPGEMSSRARARPGPLVAIRRPERCTAGVPQA